LSQNAYISKFTIQESGKIGMTPEKIKFSSIEEKKRSEMEEDQIERMDRLILAGITKTYSRVPSNQTPFKVMSSEQITREYIEPEDLKKTATARLLAGNSFKMAEMLITGTIGGILWIIIYPRLIPQPEVFGITSIVATVLGLFTALLDWGVWTGFQMMLSRSFGNQDIEKASKYTRTLLTFKIFNGLLFNAGVFIFIIFIFPNLNMFGTWQEAYKLCFIFFSIRWFVGFGAIYEHVIAAGKRFDWEFYMSLVSLGVTLTLKLFFLWYFNTYIFPSDAISANATAIVISDTIELVIRYLMQGLVIRKLKILPVSAIIKPGFKKEEFREMLKYGSFVVGRTVLSYFSEAGSFLWIILLTLTLQGPNINPAEFIGYWNLAASLVSIFLIATSMTRPIFPAISDAFIKEQRDLIQQYCNQAAKWFFRWAIFILGLYIGFGEHILIIVSGESWKLSGQIMRVIAPAAFIKFGNEYLIGILNATGKPKKVMIGTLLKIPVMVIMFLIIGTYSIVVYDYSVTTETYGFYATIYFIIELVFCIYLLKQIKETVNLKIAKNIWIIPTIACIVSMILPGFIFWRIWTVPERGIMNLILMVLIYIVFYVFTFLWLGGADRSDFEDLELSLKNFMPDLLAKWLVIISHWLAKLSPLYNRFNTEEDTKK
jgi:O-antigen/teichoic acid export membrane protein